MLRYAGFSLSLQVFSPVFALNVQTSMYFGGGGGLRMICAEANIFLTLVITLGRFSLAICREAS
jgi:hypothetical protein